MNSLSKGLFISGFLFLIFGAHLVQQRFSPNKLEFSNLKTQSVIVNSASSPVRIMIPSLHIDNKIISQSIINDQWQVTGEGVSYLSSSPIPGNTGNSILYGHNWTSILGSLPRIKPGEKIIIVMDNGDVKEFIVKYTIIVDPTQTSILAQSKDTRITIYTCTGFLDSKRFVATATLAR